MSMKMVFCPDKGKKYPANLTAKMELRCVGCGRTHTEAKMFEAVDMTVTSTKKKHFKKGGKSKGKKKADQKGGKKA